MDIFIVTGASKGIGEELYDQIQKSGSKVFGIARSNPKGYENFEEADLTNKEARQGVIERLLTPYLSTAESFTLINNAGTVEPVEKIGGLSTDAIQQAIELNLTAPIELANEFMSVLSKTKAKKQIMNISSGAGRNAYEGWGIYCTTKAGLDRFSEVVRLEQQRVEYPVGIVSIAPGIIDTGMQETIRSSDVDGFPMLEQFINYKEEGKLRSAEATAQLLLEWMEKEDLTTTDVLARLS
ncbi:SDR family NAD(P)-dependent oxidoreductase [Sporosarcina sp. BI001-red]|uniref:SDR family NAD(P)-dependent oxidoreductase n=1 Tax=Sporosarcina sp. BI001-red TaxID=2282866 RepID=UPI000E2678D3|nr:SDR family NAD(P)-dependent oxidoreductase [Sporosarcina sp. BI001-red]REB06501.1 SDR family NAD(P)-dependent oxidoreductase [Sporosarcina sp. BI001-red]